jgi:hypothetical protein
MTFEIAAAGRPTPLPAAAEFVTELLDLSLDAAAAITVTFLFDAAY